MSTGKSWEHRKLKRGGLKKMGKLKYRKVTPIKWWTEAQTGGTLKWKMAQKRAWSPKTWWRHTCENERRRAQTLGCEKRPELGKQDLGQWGPRPPRPERPRSRAGHPLGGPQGEPWSGYAQRLPGSCTWTHSPDGPPCPPQPHPLAGQGLAPPFCRISQMLWAGFSCACSAQHHIRVLPAMGGSAGLGSPDSKAKDAPLSLWDTSGARLPAAGGRPSLRLL